MTNKKKTSLKAAITGFNQKYEVVKKNGRPAIKRKKPTPKPLGISLMRKFKPKAK